MYVPRATYSLRMSFWIVPESFSRGTPLSSPTTRYIASSVEAVALIVIEVETLSSGTPVEERGEVVDGVDRDADAPTSPARAASRSRSPSASAGRTRPTGRSGRRPEGA